MGKATTIAARNTSIKQMWQSLVRRRLWKMDIHASAWIAETALIDRTWPRGIHIGPNAVIDHEAVVLSHDQTRGLYCDTHIGAAAYVGARAIVLPGLSVGAGSVVEPGSVVTRDVDAGARVAGNPAQIVES